MSLNHYGNFNSILIFSKNNQGSCRVDNIVVFSSTYLSISLFFLIDFNCSLINRRTIFFEYQFEKFLDSKKLTKLIHTCKDDFPCCSCLLPSLVHQRPILFRSVSIISMGNSSRQYALLRQTCRTWHNRCYNCSKGKYSRVNSANQLINFSIHFPQGTGDNICKTYCSINSTGAANFTFNSPDFSDCGFFQVIDEDWKNSFLLSLHLFNFLLIYPYLY